MTRAAHDSARRVTRSAAADAPRVRAANASDYPAIERVLTSAKLPTVGVAASLETFLVAEHRGALVGVAGLEICSDNALLRSVAVVPDWQARGLGRALVNALIHAAERRQVRALYLLTTTAEPYFARFGFRPEPRDSVPPDIAATDEFRTACPVTATLMRRPAGSADA